MADGGARFELVHRAGLKVCISSHAGIETVKFGSFHEEQEDDMREPRNDFEDLKCFRKHLLMNCGWLYR